MFGRNGAQHRMRRGAAAGGVDNDGGEPFGADGMGRRGCRQTHAAMTGQRESRGPRSAGPDNGGRDAGRGMGRGMGRGGHRAAFSGVDDGFGHGIDGGMRGPHGRRRGRAMDGGALQLLLLSLIAETPRHGYELIRAIEEKTGGAYVPSPGMVYPALSFLEEAGQIEASDSDGPRKAYRPTDAGRARLSEEADRLAMVEQRLAMLAGDAPRGDIQPVRRAMHNLKSVLMTRLSSGDVPVELQHRIVDVIDDAARQIERMS